MQLADDPAQRQEIIGAIRVLTQARFDHLTPRVRGHSRETLKPEEYDQALRGLNLGEQLALENLDTEKFDEISAAAAEQVSFINKDIENLRLAFELADDPTERQAILDTIKILTRARFDILREELEAIRERLKPEEYQQALRGLNLSETLALENIDTEKFGVISRKPRRNRLTFVNGAIGNLELALQLTDDPAEITAILTSIRTLTAKRFEILIAELKAIEDSFDDPAVFAQALEGLQLGSQVALRGIDRRSADVAVGRIGTALSEADGVINDLFGELAEQTTPEGVREAIGRLRSAIQAKYFAMREKINASAESEEEKARQIAAVNIEETSALGDLNRQGVDAFSSLVDTSQFLLDNATEAEFGTRRQNLITAINTFYDERIAFINGLDLSDTDRSNMLEVARIQRQIALDAVPEMHAAVAERLEMEQRVQEQIADLRADEAQAEANRLETLADLHARHNQRIVDLEEELNRDLEDLRRDRYDDARSDALDYQRDLEDLQTEYARKLFGDSVISFGDLTEEQRRQLEQNRGYQREAFDLERERDRDRQDRSIEFGGLTPGSGGYNFYRQQLESGQLTDENLIRQLFGTQGRDDFLGFQQGITEADQDLGEGIDDANAEAEANAAAISEALAPLLSQGMTIAELESETATTESETASMASELAKIESATAMTNSATAETQKALLQTQETSIGMLQDASLLMNESALNLQTAGKRFRADT